MSFTHVVADRFLRMWTGDEATVAKSSAIAEKTSELEDTLSGGMEI